jgi:iron complex outermembrane receptor protein
MINGNRSRNLKKQTFQKIFFFLLFFHEVNLSAQSLSGIVTDAASHQPLSSVSIYFPRLKTGATTDSKGYYKINHLPKGVYELKIQTTGYAPLKKQVTIFGDSTLDFSLDISSVTLKEVVITSLGNATTLRRSPVPVTVVTHEMFTQQSSTNVIDAIAKQPGISEITEGPGISKPEINGLGYLRVLTLFDGERQEDFQWGDEHGILIDPYSVHDAEIIRGSASLQYGANAVAGVISFKSDPVAENGTIQGSVQSEYQTNNGLIGNSVNIGGNKNGLAWDVRGSYEAAHCYWDPHDGYVWGTAFNQGNLRGMLEWNRKWGYSRFSISILHRQIEVPDGNRDSTTGQFEFDYPQNGQLYPTKANYLSYSPDIAGYQVLDHDELWWQNSINAGPGKISADIGYTQSHRQEFDTGTVAEYNITAHDIPYSFKYQVKGTSGLKLTTGINGMYEFGNNAPEPPAPYIRYFEIPNYTDFDIGGYAILGKDYKNLTLSGGLRYDIRSIAGQQMYLSNYNTPQQQQVPAGTPGAYTQFLGFNDLFSGLSGSIGVSYRLPGNNYVKMNLAKSYRAPSIQELNSNSLNAGANAYVLGYTNLKAEQGYQADIAYGNTGKNISFEVDGFYNYIHNFIFSDRLSSKSGGDSILQSFPVFQYQSNTAIITGATAYFNIHPTTTKWLEINNGVTYIYSFLPNQTDSTQHVPLIPAPRLTTKVRFNLLNRQGSVLSKTYFELGAEHDWAQNNIYSELYTELPSDAYTLYNAGFGTNFINPKTKHIICSLFINCTNLMNIAYVDHTSHVQYFRAYDAVPVTVTQLRQGIYNMGRNLGIKAVFPIGNHKVSDTEIYGIDKP